MNTGFTILHDSHVCPSSWNLAHQSLHMLPTLNVQVCYTSHNHGSIVVVIIVLL